MNATQRICRGLLCVVLALTPVLFPTDQGISLAYHFDLGWPLPTTHMQLYLDQRSHKVIAFDPYLPSLPLVCILWLVVAWFLLSVWVWAAHHGGRFDLPLRLLLASSYVLLLCFFLPSLVHAIRILSA